MKKYIFIISLTIVMMNTNTILLIIAKNAAPKKLCLHKNIYDGEKLEKYIFLLNNNEYILEKACKYGKIDYVKKFIHYGSYKQYLIACEYGQEKVVEIFLQNGVIDKKNYKCDDIFIACVKSHLNIVKILQKYRSSDPAHDYSFLREALRSNNIYLVYYLLLEGKIDFGEKQKWVNYINYICLFCLMPFIYLTHILYRLLYNIFKK